MSLLISKMICYFLQFTSKQLEKLSKKAEKEQKLQQQKVKKVSDRVAVCLTGCLLDFCDKAICCDVLSYYVTDF